MVQYDKKVLNKLLDSYEESTLFTGKNKISVNISFPFNRKLMPVYFDENSLAYEDIHAAMKELEKKEFIYIVWKKKKENHIISKIVLRVENVGQVYDYVKRIPKSNLISENIQLLEEMQGKYKTPICTSFIEYLIYKVKNNQTVKELIDLKEISKTEKLINGIAQIEENNKECYIREFSIKCFHDSKTFESLKGKIKKVFQMFGKDLEEKGLEEILAEYKIYHTPNYVYFKGNIRIYIQGQELDIGALKQGIGVSGEDIENIRFKNLSSVKKVITIENLTSFFRWTEQDCLIIYLGGYHNSIRRALLEIIYSMLPDIEYYHFGDIDAGGFDIYEDLCGKTNIPFKTYKMDLKTLKMYQKYGKPLTPNDRIRIEKLLLKGEKKGYEEVLNYMLLNNVKLEQECIIRD